MYCDARPAFAHDEIRRLERRDGAAVARYHRYQIGLLLRQAGGGNRAGGRGDHECRDGSFHHLLSMASRS